jgi:ABC-2 type transport system permease protein
MKLGLYPIVAKEVIELRRDKLSLLIFVFLPPLLLFLYGYAISLDVKHIPTAVLDLDNSLQSRELTRKLFASEYFDRVAAPPDESGIDDLMRRGTVTVSVIMRKGFANDLKSGGAAALQIILDGSNAQVAQSALGYLYGITSDFQRQSIAELARKFNVSYRFPEVRDRVWYNEKLESSINLITGLIAFVLMIVAVIATSISSVREKENGSIEQMVVTPVSPIRILIGKLVPYFALALASSGLMILLARLIFQVPFRGSPLLFCAALFIFLFGALTMGLFISTIAQSQQFAFTLATFITLLPTNILSGFIFPIDSMPVAIQYVTYIIPARYFIEITRAIMLKGAGFLPVWKDFAALGVFAVFFITASVIRIRVKGLI